MSSFKSLIFIAVLGIILGSCSHSTESNWTSAVPQETSFIILPAKNATVQTVLQSEYMPFIDDLSSSALQLVSKIDSTADQPMPVRSILLYPGTKQKFAPIWVTNAPDNFRQKLEKKYDHRFAQNEYHFHDITILNLQLGERHMFVARLNDFLLISESSLGVENAIRAYRGLHPGVNFANVDMAQGSIIMNTPSLDTWISQLARVKLQPTIQHAFNGTSPTLLKIKKTGKAKKAQYHFSGQVTRTDEANTPLIKAVSSQNQPITLDNYVSSNAAAFGIFHAEAPQNLPASFPDTSQTDSYFINHPDAYHNIAQTLDSEFGMVMYAESGFLSTGEYIYLRKLKNPEELQNQLEKMGRENHVNKVDSVYFAQSYSLAQMLGSRMCNFSDYYINVVGDAAILSKRKGLVEMVESDRERRHVITFESFYQEIKSGLPEDLSSLFVSGPKFTSFLSPFLTTDSNINAFTSKFNYAALTTRIDDSGNKIDINLSTFQNEKEKEAYRERWVFDIGGAELSGNPVLGNIGGSYDDEVVFATKNGSVYALATDGTVVQRYNTGSDVPIGSPVVYDWYGAGQKVVLIAAGNKIYGWDENGDLLPRFPFQLNEKITTPLTVSDINHNKLPDAIVGTADRKIHVLNGRGNDLLGWPVTVNAPLEVAPLAGYYDGGSSVIAFAANAVHAWDAAGNTLSGFPQFINAEFRGAPVKYKDDILGGAVDGKLYAIGNQPLFADTLNVYQNKSSDIQALYVSGSALTGAPFVHANSILTTSANGSVFLLNSDGKLQLTKNMGQPSAPVWSSQITDINNDGNEDIISLADYGRLYAWQISNGKRIFDLPTTGMRHVTLGDLDGDGQTELIAQTDEGVRCWTINRTK